MVTMQDPASVPSHLQASLPGQQPAAKSGGRLVGRGSGGHQGHSVRSDNDAQKEVAKESVEEPSTPGSGLHETEELLMRCGGELRSLVAPFAPLGWGQHPVHGLHEGDDVEEESRRTSGCWLKCPHQWPRGHRRVLLY